MDEFKNNTPENTDEIIDEINNTADETTEETVESADETFEETFEEELAEPKKGILREILDWLVCIVVAVAIALVIRNFVFTLVNVSGPSMNPTLNDKDVLYVNRMFYEPEVGDIIIFEPKESPDTPYVKRVIATEGQTVDINPYNGEVSVDGKVCEENYILEPINAMHYGDMQYPYTVPEDHVFAMGDNRNNSLDSRMSIVGPVSEDSIIGKAIFRIFPLSTFGSLYE